MAKEVCLVWHDRDLRLTDNPALHQAGDQLLPVYIHAPKERGGWALGGASLWWLEHSLTSLAQQYSEKGVPLLIREGPSLEVLRKLIAQHAITRVVWNERCEPALRERDQHIAQKLRADGVKVDIVADARLCDPDKMLTGSGKPYSVYTPYYKAYLRIDAQHPLLAPPDRLSAPISRDDAPASLKLEGSAHWARGWLDYWTPGEIGARCCLEEFEDAYPHYASGRDILAEDGTSLLSPHLAFGEISPRQIYHWLSKRWASREECPVLRQLVWREFSQHFIYNFPKATDEPWRSEFAHFPWEPDNEALSAWQKGLTGFPIVDAGMRQLWQTGWMHNRARMIVGSFLVKDLLIPWQEGARWFWDCLVDADLCNNSFGWQWVAGSGADAAPFFRIFNPTLQGERFDPEGDYVKRWVPELASLPAKYIHKPWDAPELLRASIDYPPPMLDHQEARDKALVALKSLPKK